MEALRHAAMIAGGMILFVGLFALAEIALDLIISAFGRMK